MQRLCLVHGPRMHQVCKRTCMFGFGKSIAEATIDAICQGLVWDKVCLHMCCTTCGLAVQLLSRMVDVWQGLAGYLRCGTHAPHQYMLIDVVRIWCVPYVFLA